MSRLGAREFASCATKWGGSGASAAPAHCIMEDGSTPATDADFPNADVAGWNYFGQLLKEFHPDRSFWSALTALEYRSTCSYKRSERRVLPGEGELRCIQGLQI